MMIVAAISVVASSNVVHAALSLVVVMAGAAAQYLLLAAEFVAVTQVLVYIGAVMVLFLFGVMLTRAQRRQGDRPQQQELGASASRSRCCMLGVHGLRADQRLRRRASCPSRSARRSRHAELSDSIFKPYLLPFWALSFVLLAAVIGAIVLARKD